eukprot:1157584-Pelagomonas_calceolata.AAC.2
MVQHSRARGEWRMKETKRMTTLTGQHTQPACRACNLVYFFLATPQQREGNRSCRYLQEAPRLAVRRALTEGLS